mgnify:CR=1 FL=1
MEKNYIWWWWWWFTTIMTATISKKNNNDHWYWWLMVWILQKKNEILAFRIWNLFIFSSVVVVTFDCLEFWPHSKKKNYKIFFSLQTNSWNLVEKKFVFSVSGSLDFSFIFFCIWKTHIQNLNDDDDDDHHHHP